ncbi:26S proteasome regulatory subunit S14 [Heterostelium album PN500]|uniref:26S proteasome regulatory subunit S14 n=1 Tax=Heterostelium pallidum (strain ATCC 26659 / Pp 5 / PN500) TaxID=670386 RepID=D3BHP3_HETP5|nr:26S proteasome regulatory subunit S14 [Heterostelium album PN500]EFA79220.1 26S proteasome regulatory subunit S14 [Heterostelium album PN500]|eukprot:XP_020431341.1 26S proteasome regulatory subunit S14 [Heterostelium album PN500]
MDITQVQKNFTHFKQLAEQPNPDVNKAKELLNHLKIDLIHLSSPTQSDHSEKVVKECLLARDILEIAALYSVKVRDISAFERFYAQLTTFYQDYKKYIQPSALQYNIIGLHLMKCLATQNAPKFHSELELIPFDMLSNPFIKFPLLVEKSIAEGSYQKVLSSRSQVPSEHYLVFIDLLSNSMREDIANCIERSFKYLTLKEAQKVLQVASLDQLSEYIKKRGWKVDGDKILFDSGPQQIEIPSTQLIHQTIHYAKELERIV